MFNNQYTGQQPGQLGQRQQPPSQYMQQGAGQYGQQPGPGQVQQQQAPSQYMQQPGPGQLQGQQAQSQYMQQPGRGQFQQQQAPSQYMQQPGPGQLQGQQAQSQYMQQPGPGQLQGQQAPSQYVQQPGPGQLQGQQQAPSQHIQQQAPSQPPIVTTKGEKSTAELSKKKEQIKLTLSIKAKDLINVAGIFKGTSDPYATVTVFSYKSHKPRVLGKTETIKNNLNPEWVVTFPLDYELGSSMNVVVNIFDEVKKGKNITMGSAAFDINKLLAATGNMMGVKLKKGKGRIIARLEEPKGTGTLRLQISGSKLKNADEGFFGTSDPFFRLRKKRFVKTGYEWDTVYRSDVIKKNLNPNWKEDIIELSHLCDGDLDAPVLLECRGAEKDGDHHAMGQVETTVNDIVRQKGVTGFYLVDKKGKAVGNLIVKIAELNGIEEKKVRSASPPTAAMGNLAMGPQPSAPKGPQPSAPMAPQPAGMGVQPIPFAAPMQAPYIAPPQPRPQATFADYMRGGIEMQLCVAIDFTGSNGDPRQPGTLHHLNPNGKNDYEKAIAAIGGVLANYDTDNQFPVWGFGAKYCGQVYHLFQCGPTAEVHGVDGIIEAYHQTFQSGLVMSSPTVLTQVIETAGAFAKKGQADARREGKNKYSILLILTDGAVSNMNATIASLRANSDAPLSIVIVGIGNADFRSMKYLDDRGSAINIVEFVEFNAHRHDPYSLTQATLSGIPDQLVNYFKRNGIPPPPPVPVREEDIVYEQQEEEIDLNFSHDANGNCALTSGGFTHEQYY